MKIIAKAKHEYPFLLEGDLANAVSFESALTSLRRASPDEIDENGHVNNVVYIAWAQDIGIAHWNSVADQIVQSDYIWVGTRHEVDYKTELLLGEGITVSTWLDPPKGPVMARHVDIRKQGSEIFAAKIVSHWCLLDTKNKKPRRIDRNVGHLFGF